MRLTREAALGASTLAGALHCRDARPKKQDASGCVRGWQSNTGNGISNNNHNNPQKDGTVKLSLYFSRI